MSMPINYVSSTIKYAKPIVYPTQNIYTTATTTTTATNSNMYVYTSSNKKKYYSTSTNPQKVRYTHYPQTQTTYYAKPQYIYPTTNQKKIVYIQTPVNVNQNTQTIKYHNITAGAYPTIKTTTTTGGVVTPITTTTTTTNNVIYNQYGERGTNYKVHNPLNLNEIYNMNNATITNPQITYESKNSGDSNIIYTDIGDFGLRNTNPKSNHKNIDPNVYFNNIDQNLIKNTTTTTETKNVGIINNDAYFNYTEYPSQPSNYININNKTTDALNIEIDELMKNAEYTESDDKFNNTMPTPKVKGQISSQYNLTVKGDNTTRKSEPNQIASNFELSIKNNPKKQYKNDILKKCNVISFQHLSTITKKTSNNVQIKTDDVKIEAQKEPEPEPQQQPQPQPESNDVQTKNEDAQEAQIDNQNPENVEYMDQFGNIYLLVNGQYIDKRYFMNQNEVKNDTNIENKTETNVEQSNNTEAVKTSVNKENEEPEHIKNKDNVYYEEDQNNPEDESPKSNTQQIIEQNQNEENQNQNDIKYHDINLNMNMNMNSIQQGYANNDYLSNAYQSQNQNIQNIQNERGNRFKQDQIIYTDVNLNNNMGGNYDYNMNLLRGQPNQINNINMNMSNDQYKKSQSDKINDNDNTIMTVQPQKPKKRRPVYKIPPSKKRAVSHGKSLNFIHKYYDENFILEEDNEDNVSDDGNKKQKKNLKSIFRGVTNMKRLTHQWQQLNENNQVEQSENIVINNEESTKTDNLDGNIVNSQNTNTNIEESSNAMRLSHIGFSL